MKKEGKILAILFILGIFLISYVSFVSAANSNCNQLIQNNIGDFKFEKAKNPDQVGNGYTSANAYYSVSIGNSWSAVHLEQYDDTQIIKNFYNGINYFNPRFSIVDIDGNKVFSDGTHYQWTTDNDKMIEVQWISRESGTNLSQLPDLLPVAKEYLKICPSSMDNYHIDNATTTSYIVIYDESASTKDVLMAYKIQGETKNNSLNYITSDYTTLENKGIKNVLERSVSVYVYNGNALIIYGSQLPSNDVVNAYKTSSIVKGMGIPNKVLGTNELTSYNLKDIITNTNFNKNTTINCNKDSDCQAGANPYSSCIGDKSCTEAATYTCLNPGAANSACSYKGVCVPCPNGCSNGVCINSNIQCYKDSDCQAGANPSSSCIENKSCTEAAIYSCLNPGTINSACQYNGTCVPCPNGCKNGFCVVGNFCNGCMLKDKCLEYGYRNQGNYCDISGEFKVQNKANSECQNNFECDSNLCVNNQCVSGSLWQKILDWFSHLFGEK